MSATKRVTIDMAPLPAMLTQLRLPTIARLWQAITETADRESWPAAKTLAALFEHELAERAQRRTARHLLEARLPAGKTIDRFDFAAAPSVSKARIVALAEGDAWLTKGTNILIFGPPGVGKSHLGAALGHAMIDAERAVLKSLPTQPAMTWEEMTVRVTSASGFMCRHVFYTVPSRLVGHRLRLRIHDDHGGL